VRIAYTANPNRATNTRVTVGSTEGERTLMLNQQQKPPDGVFHSLGTFQFDAGQAACVTITNAGSDGHVIVDAVQFLPE
jgi:hypothetical protein